MPVIIKVLFSIDIIILVVVCHLRVSMEQQIPPISPCPNLFLYRYDGFEWFGIVEVPSQRTITLKVDLSLPLVLSKKYYGKIELLGGREAAKKSILTKSPLRYRIRFPVRSPLPTVTHIFRNKRLLCTGTPISAHVMTKIQLEHTLPLDILNEIPPNSDWHSLDSKFSTIRPAISSPTISIFEPSNYSTEEEVCGQVPMQRNQLIYGGQTVVRGRWPWLVAIYIQSSSLTFSCGGNLLTNQIIVTAAHCFQTANNRVQFDEVVVSVGRYNISKWNEPGSRLVQVKSIIIHPDYMRNGRSDDDADADIAIIILKEPVQYNEFVRPICLWSGSDDIRYVEGDIGTVVGWGLTGITNVATSVPKEIDLPIVSSETCIESHVLFRRIMSNRTYCAGKQDGRGPCNGDSGSGMMLIQNNRWVLRGIVSTGLKTEQHCDLEQFVVFTDVSQYIDWIRSYITKF